MHTAIVRVGLGVDDSFWHSHHACHQMHTRGNSHSCLDSEATIEVALVLTVSEISPERVAQATPPRSTSTLWVLT